MNCGGSPRRRGSRDIMLIFLFAKRNSEYECMNKLSWTMTKISIMNGMGEVGLGLIGDRGKRK